MSVFPETRNAVECVTASAHGRFQPFHRGHLRYVLQVKSRCQHVIIGITNPDPRHLTAHTADPLRHLPSNNPFSYYERMRMIRASLKESGLSDDQFTIVPFPIDTPESIENYCPRVPVFLRDRGAWTAAKTATLLDHGWRAEIISDETDLEINGTDIRARIKEQRPWQHLVPPACAAVLRDINAYERILALCS
jgi:cytidyltransferase-like protein